MSKGRTLSIVEGPNRMKKKKMKKRKIKIKNR